MANQEKTTKTIDDLVMDIAVEDIIQPSIPVDICIGEAADLRRFAAEDKEALKARGLDVALIDELTVRAKFLQDKQSDWNAVYQSAITNTQEWKDKVAEASLLQREIKNDFQFALRKNEDALSKLKNINEGVGKNDLMQDMSDYPKLAAKFPDELAAINFDHEKLKRANDLSHELFDLRDGEGGSKNSSRGPEKLMRDRAYTYLKILVDEIRAYGKYTFWKDEQRQKKYSSEYLRIKNNRNKPSDDMEMTEKD
jgi:hypothetical protein